MKTTSGGFHNEERIESGQVDIANMVGLPTMGSLSVGGSPDERTRDIENHQEEKAYADPICEEDGISPDDAPEVVLDDIDEEGEEDKPSMLGRLGCPKSAADAIEELQKRQMDFLSLDLRTLGVDSNKTSKNAVPKKDNAKSQKKQKNKSNKKKKDRRLVEESILRMRTSTSRSDRRVSKHIRVPTPPQQSGIDQGELIQHAFKTGANETPSQVLPLEVQSAPTTSPPATPITGVTRPSVRFADGDNTTCVVNLGSAERATTSGGPETEAKKVPLLAHTEGTISASRESADNVSDVPQVKTHSDKNTAFVHTSSTSTSVDATQSIAAEMEKAGVQGKNEMARPYSGFNHAPTDSYPRGVYDLRMEADHVDMQVDFSTPIDEDDDESDTRFGVLSNTTFHQLPPYQYGHGLNTEQDDPIIEDMGSGLAGDSVMEDATPESQNVDVPATATRTLRPFSWVPPSTSDAFHAIFPGVPFARTQMTACIDESVPVFQHGTLDGPYRVDTTIPEEARIQQVAPPQDVVWPFVLDGTYPSPSMEGGLPQEPRFIYAKPSPTSGPSVVPSQTTSHSSFASPSPLTSKVDPVLISSPTGRPIQVHKPEIKDFEGEVCSEPAGTASVQPEVPPPRFYTHNDGHLNVSASQWRTRSSPANSDISLPSPLLGVNPLLSSPLLTVDTTVFNHLAPTHAPPIEHNEDELEDKNRHYAKNGDSEDVHAIARPTFALARPDTKIAPPPVVPITTAKPPPPVPPRIVGSKRKFVDDQRPRYNSINPARKLSKLPRSKKPKIEHGDYSTHKRLGEVKAMHRREGGGTKLPEEIKFATRHTMPVWSSSSSPTRHQRSGGASDWAS